VEQVLSYAAISHALESLDGWVFEDETSISRRFVFPAYLDALGFVVMVAAAAEAAGHHPAIAWELAHVDIILTTPEAGGVTRRDLSLAARINALQP